MLESFKVRALEVDDTHQMWSVEKMQRVFAFMLENNMNTLIFHENNIVDKVVWPGFVYGYDKDDLRSYSIYREGLYRTIYDRTPSPYVFVDELMIFRDLMKTITKQAKDLGIDMYFQTKEIWFPEILYERQDLMKNGKMCPSEPWWWEEYLPRKYEELMQNFPELAGVITSTGTKESRISLAHHKCNCEKCRNMDPGQWQRNVLMGMYEPLHRHGKKLVARDFSYYADEQAGIRNGLLDLPEDVVICIKNVPQDYYQTFPNNDLIGKCGNHEQWVEYETFGEYYGWGITPCTMVEDMQYRLKHCLDNGVDGVTTRIDWEAMPNYSVFESMSKVNLYSCAMLSENINTPARSVYERWFRNDGLYKENITPEEIKACLDKAELVFPLTWPIMAKTPFLKDAVFMNNCKIPVSLDCAEFISEEHHGIQKWFPEYKDHFNYTYEQSKAMMDEKDEALKEVLEANRLWKEGGNPGFADSFYDDMCKLFDLYVDYVKLFRMVGHSYVIYKYCQKNDIRKKDPEAFKSYMEREKELVEEMKAFEVKCQSFDVPFRFKYPTLAMMNPERLRVYREDVENYLASIGC